jgi:hypothetical protein
MNHEIALMEQKLQYATEAISRAEQYEQNARNCKDENTRDCWLRTARIAREGADKFLGTHDYVCPYGTSKLRTIDIIVNQEVARMVAHAEAVTRGPTRLIAWPIDDEDVPTAMVEHESAPRGWDKVGGPTDEDESDDDGDLW